MTKPKDTINFGAVANRMKTAITMYGNTEALRLEATAKKEAPWSPVGPGTPYYQITGLARATITAKHEVIGGSSRIVLSGNMPYSIFLELAMDKKYAILLPTVQGLGPAILRGYKELIK